MIPFIGFSGPYIFGDEFGSYDKNLSDFEGIEHEACKGGKGGDGFAKAHFDENAGGWVSEDVVDDVELVGMEVGFVHVGRGIAEEKVIRLSFSGHSIVDDGVL
jgi:hypothetical protein